VDPSASALFACVTGTKACPFTSESAFKPASATKALLNYLLAP
jgi:hypothetical protein